MTRVIHGCRCNPQPSLLVSLPTLVNTRLCCCLLLAPRVRTYLLRSRSSLSADIARGVLQPRGFAQDSLHRVAAAPSVSLMLRCPTPMGRRRSGLPRCLRLLPVSIRRGRDNADVPLSRRRRVPWVAGELFLGAVSVHASECPYCSDVAVAGLLVAVLLAIDASGQCIASPPSAFQRRQPACVPTSDCCCELLPDRLKSVRPIPSRLRCTRLT